MTDVDYEKMSAFSCGVDELDYFFRYEVAECVSHRYLSAYCAFLASGEIVAAFISRQIRTSIRQQGVCIVSYE